MVKTGMIVTDPDGTLLRDDKTISALQEKSQSLLTSCC